MTLTENGSLSLFSECISNSITAWQLDDLYRCSQIYVCSIKWYDMCYNSLSIVYLRDETQILAYLA